MRIAPFLVSVFITAALVYVCNKPWAPAVPMPIGKFLSPQTGFWQNAESSSQEFNADLKFPQLKGNASVYFDERLIPHVFAENDEDLYFIQGYLHAKFRLFQMDLSTKAAEGRASEIAGPKAVKFDKEQRRLGMKYAAETAEREVEKDPKTKSIFDAYSNGVNAYIQSLTESSLPLEYKMLNLKPERWSNLRTALLLKMMAKMLASGTERDLAYTNAKAVFSMEDFKLMYPEVPDSLQPIIPRGTVFDKPGIVPVMPATADSLYFNAKQTQAAVEVGKPDPDNGSNNWVVAGSKTKSGAPILCNDPHLDLSLPSIWYEMELSVGAIHTYGVSLPGSPFIIIGFNDQIAWGETNAQRDVKDYFEIKFKDASRQQYWYNGHWVKASQRIDTIKVAGSKEVYDTVSMTVFGPVMFDGSFGNEYTQNRALAVRWTAHDPSNEGLTLYRLNRARSYEEYEAALKTYQCPAQNFVFASKSGDIAIWQQGKFPARWPGQGMFVMPGEDSSYAWQGFIPQSENPHALNPASGFLESANQRPVDSTYPYFIPGDYITPRGRAITNALSSMNGITPEDMEKLQNSYYNNSAADIRTILLKYVQLSQLTADSKKYVAMVRNWDLVASPSSKEQTIYRAWWDSVEVAIWKDDIMQVKPQAPWPSEQTTFELLARDSAMKFIDNILTPHKETIEEIVTTAIKKATLMLKEKEAEGKLEWSKFKDPGIFHILDVNKETLLPLDRPHLSLGGDGTTVNAITKTHGPSWRMVVQLSTPIIAYGVYPGGQSGNPGSRYYDNDVDTWATGKYHPLWLMTAMESTDSRIKWTMKFSKN